MSTDHESGFGGLRVDADPDGSSEADQVVEDGVVAVSDSPPTNQSAGHEVRGRGGLTTGTRHREDVCCWEAEAEADSQREGLARQHVVRLRGWSGEPERGVSDTAG